jgi:CRP-like cAMP-binding protein
VSTIADHCEGQPVISFEPGAVLLPEGGSTGKLYVLLEGTVEVLKGDFQVNIVDDRGAIFGDMSALLGIPHMATVRAMTAGRAYVIEGGAAYLHANKEISFLLAQLLAQRLHGVTGYLVDIKRQFEDHAGHLGIVDEILESLLHNQRRAFTAGSDREPDY